ncbi:hypothetical protein VP01_2442g3, partial [Puccinia sorghi]
FLHIPCHQQQLLLRPAATTLPLKTPQRWRGRTEEVPRKEYPTAAGMMMMMQKSEQAIEERQILQAQINREMMAQRQQEVDAQAIQLDEDCKEECCMMAERAQEARSGRRTSCPKGRRPQGGAAQEKSQQVFETAMLPLLSNITRGSS